MRVARYFPTVVAALASFAWQTTTTSSCGAWESIPAAALAESRDLDGGEYITDHEVQPAGFYDSRPRPNAGKMPMRSASKPAANQNSPMYRGQKVKSSLSLPFGRQTKAADDEARLAAQAQAAKLPAAAVRGQTPVAPQSRTASANSQRMPLGTPVASGMNAPAARSVAARAPQSIAKSQLQPPTAGPSIRNLARPMSNAQMPNSSSTSPWAQPAPAVPMPRPVPAATQSTSLPLSPSDELVAKAHELSTQAQSDREFTHVVDLCRQALVSQPSPTAAQYAKSLMAWSLNRRGQLKAEASDDKAALQDFEEAIHNDATCWRAVHNRGVLLAQDGQFEKAFDDFSRTIQMNPQFAKAYSNRAALFMVANTSNSLEAALQDYNRAVALDTNLAVAHRGCGRVCQLTGRSDEAMAHYDVAVRLAPSDAYAAACRADLLTDLGRYSEAATEYNRAIEIDPKSIQAVSGSAWLLATCPDSQIRNADLAIQRAQTVIELGGESEAVNFDTLAAAQANAGDFDGAMDSLQKAIELSPAEEREAYKERFIMYQQAKPYRISPVERVAQVSYEATDEVTTH